MQAAERHGRRSTVEPGGHEHRRGRHPRECSNGWACVCAFRAENRDDILFVTSEQTGFGYFRNFGETRRQGLEVGARSQVGRVTLGAGYTFLRATFESEETVNGESNSSNDAAADGEPGLEGVIEIEPGDRLPFIPEHLLKIFGDVRITSRFSLDINLLASGGSYARGNENNRHEPDGTYYLGEGAVDGYAIVNLGARYDVTRRLQVIAQLNNLFSSAGTRPARSSDQPASRRQERSWPGRCRPLMASSPCGRRRFSRPARRCARGWVRACVSDAAAVRWTRSTRVQERPSGRRTVEEFGESVVLRR